MFLLYSTVSGEVRFLLSVTSTYYHSMKKKETARSVEFGRNVRKVNEVNIEKKSGKGEVRRYLSVIGEMKICNANAYNDLA